jgi:hypothetical protein
MAIFTLDRPIRTPRNRTQPTPRIHLTVSDTTEAAIGARAAIGRTALGAERTGVAAIGVMLARVAGRIVAEQMKVVVDRAAVARAAVAKTAVPGGTAAPIIAGLAHTEVIGDLRRAVGLSDAAGRA